MNRAHQHPPHTRVCPDCDRGTWLIGTQSGTWYFLDLSVPSRRVVSRVTDPDNTNPDHALRRDGEPLALLASTPVIAGTNWIQVLDLRGDGVATVRTTNFVTTVRRLQAPSAPVS